MNEKDRIIQLLETADIQKDDWEFSILNSNTDLYAKGYIRASLSKINEYEYSNVEEYRQQLINVCNWNIWGKT